MKIMTKTFTNCMQTQQKNKTSTLYPVSHNACHFYQASQVVQW